MLISTRSLVEQGQEGFQFQSLDWVDVDFDITNGG